MNSEWAGSIKMNRYQQIAFWIFVFFATAGLIWLFQGVLAPFLLGMVIAYLLNPVVTSLQQNGLPRWASVLLVLFIFLAIMVLALAITIPLLGREVAQITEILPSLFDKLQEVARNFVGYLSPYVDVSAIDANKMVTQLQNKAGSILSAGGNVVSSVLKGGAAVASFIATAFLMPIVAFYMMLDWPHFVHTINDLLPRQHMPRIHKLLDEINLTLSGFIRGQLLVCVFLGLFYGLGLTLIGLEFGFLVGIIAGILSIMPYVGSGSGLLAGIAMAWFQTNDITMVFVVVAIFGLGQFIEGNFLTPKLVGDKVGLHPLWIIFALMAGGSLMGFTGLLIAVPVAACIGVLVRHLISEYKSSVYYGGVARVIVAPTDPD